jgi:hypothetical protein
VMSGNSYCNLSEGAYKSLPSIRIDYELRGASEEKYYARKVWSGRDERA